MFTLEFDAKTMEIMYDSVSYRVCAVYMTTLYSNYFRPSRRKRRDGVFKNSTLTGDRFRKPFFWRPKRLPLTWGQKVKMAKKKYPFSKIS